MSSEYEAPFRATPPCVAIIDKLNCGKAPIASRQAPFKCSTGDGPQLSTCALAHAVDQLNRCPAVPDSITVLLADAIPPAAYHCTGSSSKSQRAWD
jgi:hypothetical protein